MIETYSRVPIDINMSYFQKIYGVHCWEAGATKPKFQDTGSHTKMLISIGVMIVVVVVFYVLSTARSFRDGVMIEFSENQIHHLLAHSSCHVKKMVGWKFISSNKLGFFNNFLNPGVNIESFKIHS